MLTNFQTMAMSVTVERDDGTLKRLRGTDAAGGLLLGKVGLVLATSVAQLIALLLVARFLYDVQLPTDAGRWLTLAWVFFLGSFGAPFSALPIRLSARLDRSVPSSSRRPLVLQFISGVYFAFKDIPSWFAGRRDLPAEVGGPGHTVSLLPGCVGEQEMAHAWEPVARRRPRVVGDRWPAACAKTFSWYKRGTT